MSCISLSGLPCVSAVKNVPTIQEMGVQFLDQEVPLEKEMATHSSILAWKIPWTELVGCSPRGPELDMQRLKQQRFFT